ncbi:MAG: ParB/RepB/Spo0J family partition protein [Calditrichia bacterium]
MKSKIRLGKGLDALISSQEDLLSPQLKNKNLQEIEIVFVDPNPFQPRLDMDRNAFEELKKSIKEKGVIQPILVRPGKKGRYELIAGERRLRAAGEVGLTRIPAYVVNVTKDEDMLELALIENVQREHLNPIDLATGYQRLVDELHLTQEEVAAKISKDRATVSNLIRLLKLPSKIQDSIKRGEIREGHARALLGLPKESQQLQLWQKTIKQGLSVRKVEEEVKKIKDESIPSSLLVQRRKKSPIINKIESGLRETFGTQVKVRTKKDGGSIEIFFYSREDLDRLMELFHEIKV